MAPAEQQLKLSSDLHTPSWTHLCTPTLPHTRSFTHTSMHKTKHKIFFYHLLSSELKAPSRKTSLSRCKMVMCAFLNFQWGWVFWDQSSQRICEPLAGSFINVDSDRWREWNVCKNCTHLRLFDLFEINLRVSTTWNAKHMSLILNLIQHMEMFIRIRTLQTQSRR